MANTLTSTSDLQTCASNDSVLTINDDGVNINIMPFTGGCKIAPGNICLPMPFIELEVRKYGIATPWRKFAEPFADIDERILTEASFFMCANTGMTRVSIAKPGQETVRVGDAHKICEKSELYHFLEAAERELGPLSDEQRDNVELLIDAFVAFGDGDPAKLAYVLSTGKYESNFSPVREGYHVSGWSGQTDQERAASLYNDYKKRGGVDLSAYVQDSTTGQYYFGRGFVQLTHFDNYQDYTNILSNHYGIQIDLVNNPGLAQNPEYAALITVHGMMNGEFTGVGLDNYINANTNPPNFKGARRVVGGVYTTDYENGATNVLQEYENIIDALPPDEEPIDELANLDPADRNLFRFRPKGKLIAVEGAEITCPNARFSVPGNVM